MAEIVRGLAHDVVAIAPFVAVFLVVMLAVYVGVTVTTECAFWAYDRWRRA